MVVEARVSVSSTVEASRRLPAPSARILPSTLVQIVEWKKVKKLKSRLVKKVDYQVFANADETMELTGGDERIAFGPMAKGHKKYGSVARSRKRDEPSGIQYLVSRSDTLQGLAVKFGCTTEQIRRLNQLWTNDSLFLRKTIVIPLPEFGLQNDGTPHTSPTSSEVNGGTRVNGKNGSICSPDESFESPQERRWTSHPLSDSFESEDCFSSPNSSNLEQEPPAAAGNSSNNPFWSPSEPSGDSYPSTSNGRTDLESISPHSQSTPTSPTPGAAGRRFQVKDHSDNSFQDFLSRIDTAIETSRKQTKSDKEGGKQWVTFESDSESDNQRGSGTSLRTEGRHLRYSLRKLEKAQDELFQL